MRQSQLFTKTKKESPSGEVSKNAELLTRAGYVHKEVAGVYDFLPLGLRVTTKISNIIREEMDRIGASEVKMTVLQDKEVWEQSGRWNDEVVDIWFKTALKNGSELGLGNTHEEPLAKLLTHHIHSYKDLPRYLYQIQVKLRNELRAKSGLLRGREFLMKDLYSFSKDKEEHDEFYEKMKEVYKRIFERVGIGHRTYLTFASGGSFAKYSHEFQTLTAAGEDTIYLDEERGIAVNKEVYTDEVLEELGLQKENLVEHRAAEVGNIFSLGDKYAQAVNLTYTDEGEQEQYVFMGSYGIGIPRLMGVVAESLSDDNGLIWPELIAPFSVHLLIIGDDEKVRERAEQVYSELQDAGVSVLFDDRSGLSAGEKFGDSDLIGIPYRVVVSARSIEENGVELKKRTEERGSVVAVPEVITRVNDHA